MTKTNMEKRADIQSAIPLVTPGMVKGLSDERKAMLSQEVADGKFRDGNTPNANFNLTAAGNVVSSVGRVKNAQISSQSNLSAGLNQGGSNSFRQTPEVYSPLWLSSNLNLPRDRATVNAWCRAFYALNPFVHNAISLHSTYPISKLNIKCPDPEVKKFFDEMIEEIDLMNICVQIAQEYWLLGEAFVYAEIDAVKKKWSRLVIQNPDYMLVSRSVDANEPVIMLKPDENLKRIVSSNKPADIQQRKKLDRYIVDCVKRGQNITLNNFHVSHIARKISPYEIRGTGLPVCIFRQLMLMDKIREAKFAQADNMINPMTLVKVGSADYKPTAADLEGWRDIFSSAQYDKDFKIFTHEAVTVERVGANNAIMDTSGEITQLIKEIFVGLQVPSALVDGGHDTPYATAGVEMDVLKQRYMTFRNILASWLRRKIFEPISAMNGFYETKNGVKHLIVPEIDWNHMPLFDAGDYITNLIALSAPGEAGSAPRVSKQTLYRSLGLEYEDEVRKMRKESITAAIYKKENELLETMTLNQLRALGDDDEIKEQFTDEELKDKSTGGGADAPPGSMENDAPPPPPPPPAK
jgi:hypothetical protein